MIPASASLHIKGVASSSISSSLRVENSNGSASLVVRDDGSNLFVGSNGISAGTWIDATGSINLIRSAFGTTYGLRVYNGAGWSGHNAIQAIAYQYPIYGAQGSNGVEETSPLNAGAGVFGKGGVGVIGRGVRPTNDSGSIGVMATSLYVNPTLDTTLYNRSASLHVRGLGTSATGSTLLIQNSNGSASLIVTDNGVVYAPGPTYTATNTVFGNQATLLSTTGSFVTAIGYQALYNTTGLGNTAVGYQAGDGNTTGTENTYIGYIADGFSNNIGATGIGTRVSAGGFYSVAIGYAATTDGGISIGRQSRTSAGSIAVGSLAGYGSGNTNSVFIGNETGYNTNSKTGNVFIGHQAGYSENTSNKLFIANSSTTSPLTCAQG